MTRLPHTVRYLATTLALLFLCGIGSITQAQTGTIAGLVVDSEQGDPLIGATVAIVGTTQGAATDLEGRYRLTNLEPGEYDVRFSYTGYQAKTVEGVTVEAGETTRLEMDLTSETRELSEVIVSAQAARDSEAGLLRQRQRATGVSDAISAEAIGRSGAGNAADAMSKVTGASVLEGKYVTMRGLQGRYVNAQLNGTDLPSSDPDGNSVAFDLFPANLIDNIVATKTFTPDRPGNFTGGSIDISTRALPESFFFNASVSSSFDTEVGIGGRVIRPVGGLSAIPVEANSGLPDNIAQVFNDDSRAQQLEAATQAFSTPIAPTEETITVSRSAELAVGNQFSVLGGRALGIIASLSYDQSFSGFSNGTTTRFNQVGLSSETLVPSADFLTEKGREETLLGGLVGVSFQITPRHEIGARVMYTESLEEEAQLSTGALPRDLSGDQVFQTRALRTVDRSVLSGELKGTHQLEEGSGGLRVQWASSFSETSRDEPDYRLFANQFSTRGAGADTTYGISRSIYQAPTRYFRDLSEQDISGRLSAERTVGTVLLKAGGSLRQRSRTFRERRFEHLDDQTTYEGDPNRYINEQAGRTGTDSRGRNRFGTYILDRTQPSSNYNGEQDIWAGFAMAEVPVPGVPSLEFVGGARVEHTDMSVETVDGSSAGRFQETDILPSANVNWSAQRDMNLRVAYGRTLARPSFREFAPFTSFNFIADYIEIGNPQLTRTLVDNFDLRWEWFVRRGELLSAGIFHKSFQNPIERTIDTRAAGSDVVINYVNKESAEVYGAEFEFRKRLDQLSRLLRHVQVGVNVTLIQSEVSRSEDELEAIRAFDDNPSTTRALQGQSPYIVNVNAGYESPDSGTGINILAHVSSRLNNFGLDFCKAIANVFSSMCFHRCVFIDVFPSMCFQEQALCPLQ